MALTFSLEANRRRGQRCTAHWGIRQRRGPEAALAGRDKVRRSRRSAGGRFMPARLHWRIPRRATGRPARPQAAPPWADRGRFARCGKLVAPAGAQLNGVL